MPLVEENLSGLRGDESDVLVLQQRPELRDVVPAHRRGRAQLLVRRVRVTGVEVGRMQRDLVRRAASLDALASDILDQSVRFYCVYLMAIGTVNASDLLIIN